MVENIDNLFQIEWNQNDQIESVYRNNIQSIHEAINSTINPIEITNRGIVLNANFEELLISLLNTLASLNGDTVKKILFSDFIFGHIYPRFGEPNPKLQSEFWKAVVQIIWNWEDDNEVVHKGTPYYFMAESFLTMGDIASAYISFFSAIEEDKRSYPLIPNKNYKDAAAFKTTSLINDPNNALYLRVVIPLKAYLYSFISSSSYPITLTDIDEKFFLDDDFEDIKRFFVANFHEIYHLGPLYSTRLINNDYSKLKITDSLFNIALIIDQILEKKFLASYRSRQKKMANAVYELALHRNWTDQTTDRNARNFLNKICPNPNSGKPDEILPSYLDGSATYDGNSMDLEMRSIILAYHVRNYGAHHLEGNNILITEYQEILHMIMIAFFVTINSL